MIPEMAWSELAQQFCLELGFGLLLALAFVPRAPVGTLFYRIMGTAAALPIGCALVMRLRAAGLALEPVLLGSALALASFPVYSGPVRGRSWAIGLGLGLVGSGGGAALLVHRGLAELGILGRTVASASALATGAVAGSVGLAMVLGHWYLTVPRLEIGHLQRLNRVSIGAMLAAMALSGGSCLFFAEFLRGAELPLFGPTGLFYLGTRLAVGLAVPLLFAAMAESSLRLRNTRSATGILYASTVLVLIGTAVSLFLQDSYRIPL
jgi:hypothetical protein